MICIFYLESLNHRQITWSPNRLNIDLLYQIKMIKQYLILVGI